MDESSIRVAPDVRARERVVVDVNSPAARWVGALALLSAACWLMAVIARGHDHAGWHATGRLEWSLTVLAAVTLIARVWPETFVEDNNLRVHLALLRKALHDGQDQVRYILNVPGRGYRFAFPVNFSRTPAGGGTSNLPGVLTRLIGRAGIIWFSTTGGAKPTIRSERIGTVVH